VLPRRRDQAGPDEVRRALKRWTTVSIRPMVQHVGHPRHARIAVRPAATARTGWAVAFVSAQATSSSPASPRSRCRLTVRLQNGEYSARGGGAEAGPAGSRLTRPSSPTPAAGSTSTRSRV